MREDAVNRQILVPILGANGQNSGELVLKPAAGRPTRERHVRKPAVETAIRNAGRAVSHEARVQEKTNTAPRGADPAQLLPAAFHEVGFNANHEIAETCIGANMRASEPVVFVVDGPAAGLN